MYTLTAVIDRFERGKAVVRFDDGQELILAKRQLPSSVKEGTPIELEIFAQKEAELRRRSVAHYLLQEIMKPHEPKETTDKR